MATIHSTICLLETRDKVAGLGYSFTLCNRGREDQEEVLGLKTKETRTQSLNQQYKNFSISHDLYLKSTVGGQKFESAG
ncbi:hypothetical protein BDV06DRAFT_229533 [Aspergillus oleicola]